MCWRSSMVVGFCNDIEHVGPRWMLRIWQPPLSPSTASSDWFWFCHNLSFWLSSSRLFWAFSRLFLMHIDGAYRVTTPLQCFLHVFGLGFSFHGFPLLCWFCDYKLFLGFWVWSCNIWILDHNLAWKWRRSRCIHSLIY